MTKKNQQPSPKISDGQSPEVKSGGFTNPGMRLSTMVTVVTSMRTLIDELSGEPTKASLVLKDLILLLDAIGIRYGDRPIVVVADWLIDEAHNQSVDSSINN